MHPQLPVHESSQMTSNGIAERRANAYPAAGAYPGVMSVPWVRVRAMRLLHTSDWHLGRSLHRADLRAAQSAFLDHLVEVARAEKVDAVLVAGDIYDRAVPPVDAVELCEDALLRLHDTGARIVLISGNHDSARRLGFGGGLLEKAGVHLRTRPGALARPVVLEDAHGPVAVYGVPYLEPDAVRGELPQAQDGPARGRPARARRGARARGRLHPGRRRGPRHPAPRRHGPRLGHRRSGQRIRARYHRRRRRPGARRAVRRVRLRGPRAPARPADRRPAPALQRLAAAVLVLRGVAPQGQLAGRAGRHGDGARGAGARARLPAAERAPRPARRPARLGRLRPRTRTTSCPSRSPIRAVPREPMDALRARFPHVLVLAFEPEGASPTGAGTGPGSRAATICPSPPSSSGTSATRPPTAGEERLLGARSRPSDVDGEEAAG